jgi:hypothetical protein
MKNELNAGERANQLQRLLHDILTPVLRQTDTLASLRQHGYASRTYWLVTGPAQVLLADEPTT